MHLFVSVWAAMTLVAAICHAAPMDGKGTLKAPTTHGELAGNSAPLHRSTQSFADRRPPFEQGMSYTSSEYCLPC
jgi:hypothetical protein